ncbi:MAG TPA: DUF362 domain-containing protein [Bryobacteraceae bacterium]|nr:DUF362 domain-containing protein [Bryobacteraceae bacterium]
MLVKLLRLGGLSAGAAGLGVWLNGRSRRPEEPAAELRKHLFTIPEDSSLPQAVIVKGDDPRQLVRRAIQELGGIQRFVSRGDTVVIKPNVAWDRTPAQAANTNPEIVAEMVRLCRGAGAKSVVVTDVSINEPRRCFERSGIAAAASAEGAQIILPGDGRFRQVDLRGEVLRSWPVFEPFLTADKMINIPVAKHHSLTGATLGMKNWYGILGGQRHRLHQRIHESLVDLADFMRPTLTLIDAYRVLLRNGPGGGNLSDVALQKTVIAGTDPVALDAYAAKAYWDLDSTTLRYLKLASDRGLGNLNFENIRSRAVGL